ncbi:YjgB family protein [Saccharibacillus alkalitolerans]|uniref:YjgB family protein n=1 Tax=Saccharibacillus alkalitolerans TaxID=2705290 RepID=A0ABX0FBQ2_9BACL|nr:YjgB family protein [Saccharibacillus alkalitolerans]NGZ77800.1 YjgB family protein [Saccharibacillus alkalitolerans]
MIEITRMRKNILTLSVAGLVGFGSLGAAVPTLLPSASAAQTSAASSSAMARETLMSFYKPALNGEFPGNADGFVVGETKRTEIIDKFGSPNVPRSSVSGFDNYTADMGNPGYAMSYDASGVLKEIRYFGTNVERQTNIGGITLSMVKKNWYTPISTTTIKSGGAAQTKLTYKRGKYKVEFVFNNSVELSHINLLKS